MFEHKGYQNIPFFNFNSLFFLNDVLIKNDA